MSETGDPLDIIPPAILADVLGLVADTGDLASCRFASRALLAASYHCPRVSLSAAARARLLREGGDGDGGIAFRLAAAKVASLIGQYLRSLALYASEGQGFPDDAMWVEEGEFDEGDDLHLTSEESVASWAATAAGPALREVDIADFWPQACWRKAEALPIMPTLTHLALEYIRLDDEDLSALNRCFPYLEILNLIGVGGLKDPKIDLPQLKTCCWEVSNIRRSLAIHDPKLVYLELKCVRPEILILDIPSVSTLKLTIDKLGSTVQADGLVNLANLRIESLDLTSLMQLFTGDRNIRTLDLEIPVSANCIDLYDAVMPDYLLQLFARITEVKLSPRLSRELMRFLVVCLDCEFTSCLKKLLVHLPPSDITDCPFVPLLNNCAASCEVTVLFHADSSAAFRQAAASVWPLDFSGITWQWGEGRAW